MLILKIGRFLEVFKGHLPNFFKKTKEEMVYLICQNQRHLKCHIPNIQIVKSKLIFKKTTDHRNRLSKNDKAKISKTENEEYQSATQ